MPISYKIKVDSYEKIVYFDGKIYVLAVLSLFYCGDFVGAVASKVEHCSHSPELYAELRDYRYLNNAVSVLLFGKIILGLVFGREISVVYKLEAALCHLHSYGEAKVWHCVPKGVVVGVEDAYLFAGGYALLVYLFVKGEVAICKAVFYSYQVSRQALCCGFALQRRKLHACGLLCWLLCCEAAGTDKQGCHQ